MKTTIKCLGLGSLMWLAACSAGPNETNVELIQDMMDQISIRAQGENRLMPGTPGNFIPPAGTKPKGFTPYPYAGNPELAGKELKNPLAGDFSPKTLELGKTQYQMYCLVCHGAGGTGDGKVAAKMIVHPPSLLSEKVRQFPDGRIFHIMTEGQGVMGSYYQQLRDPKLRWAVVNYVRSLQKSSPATK